MKLRFQMELKFFSFMELRKRGLFSLNPILCVRAVLFVSPSVRWLCNQTFFPGKIEKVRGFFLLLLWKIYFSLDLLIESKSKYGQVYIVEKSLQ